jgi:hypothetical protein
MPHLISIDQQLKDAAKIITNPPLIIPAQKSDSSLFFDFPSIISENFDHNLAQVINEDYDYSRHYRLGLYYEHMLKQIFSAVNNIIINHHTVLQDDKRTLGELDFLLQLPKLGTTHLELAYKVYALTENGWRGPNPTDSITKKVVHLFSKQLKLYHRFTQQWENKGLARPDNFQALIQGRLFLPFKEDFETKIDKINVLDHQFDINVQACNSGKWCLNKDFTDYAEQSAIKHWQLLNKPSWLCAQGEAEGYHFTEIEALIQPHQSAILKGLSEDSAFNVTNNKQQENLVLLLPNDWPNTR